LNEQSYTSARRKKSNVPQTNMICEVRRLSCGRTRRLKNRYTQANGSSDFRQKTRPPRPRARGIGVAPDNLRETNPKRAEESFMADRIIEVNRDGGSGMTAIAIVLLVIVLLAVLYFTGAFSRMFGGGKHEIDVNINKPGVVLQIT
jgi:hypothetical protein